MVITILASVDDHMLALSPLTTNILPQLASLRINKGNVTAYVKHGATMEWSNVVDLPTLDSSKHNPLLD